MNMESYVLSMGPGKDFYEFGHMCISAILDM